MVAAVATVTVWLPLAWVSTVIEAPLTAVTSPVTKAAFAWPLGRGVVPGRGLKPGRGLAPGPGLGPKLRVAHPVDVFGEMSTVVAVTAPVVPFWPVAKMHAPRVMSARVAIEVLVNVVAVVYMTVMSPLGPVRMRVCPLICTNWPEAPLRNPLPAPGLGVLELLEALAAAPHAANTNAPAAATATAGIARFIVLPSYWWNVRIIRIIRIIGLGALRSAPTWQPSALDR